MNEEEAINAPTFNGFNVRIEGKNILGKTDVGDSSVYLVSSAKGNVWAVVTLGADKQNITNHISGFACRVMEMNGKRLNSGRYACSYQPAVTEALDGPVDSNRQAASDLDGKLR